VNLNLAKKPCKPNMVGWTHVLPAKDKDLVVEECLMDQREQVLTDIDRQIHIDNLGTKYGCQRCRIKRYAHIETWF
jgi:hypothetical protein